MVSNLQDQMKDDAQAESAVAGGLSENLPLIASSYAKSFALVDPRLMNQKRYVVGYGIIETAQL